MTKEQLLSGVEFRMKGADVNTYRIDGDMVQVKIGYWFPVAILIYEDCGVHFISVRSISWIGMPAWRHTIFIHQIEEV